MPFKRQRKGSGQGFLIGQDALLHRNSYSGMSQESNHDVTGCGRPSNKKTSEQKKIEESSPFDLISVHSEDHPTYDSTIYPRSLY